MIDQVDLLQLRVETKPEIQVVSTWGNAFFASCLTVQTLDNGSKQRLHVGDGMRSVCALERGSKGELVDVARDMRPHWILTMEELDADGGAVAFSDVSEVSIDGEIFTDMNRYSRRQTTIS